MCCVSVSDDDVEPDDIRSETSVDGLSPTAVTTLCSNSADFLSMQKENWVTSVAALHNTDLVASGKNVCWLDLCRFLLDVVVRVMSWEILTKLF